MRTKVKFYRIVYNDDVSCVLYAASRADAIGEALEWRDGDIDSAKECEEPVLGEIMIEDGEERILH